MRGFEDLGVRIEDRGSRIEDRGLRVEGFPALFFSDDSFHEMDSAFFFSLYSHPSILYPREDGKGGQKKTAKHLNGAGGETNLP